MIYPAADPVVSCRLPQDGLCGAAENPPDPPQLRTRTDRRPTPGRRPGGPGLALQHGQKPDITFLVDWVANGFLMAVGLDSKDNGRHLGKQLIRVLRGQSPGSIPIGVRESPRVTLNLERARLIGIAFPLKVLESSDRLYKTMQPWVTQ